MVEHNAKAQQTRAARWALRRRLRSRSSIARVQTCGRPVGQFVELRRRTDCAFASGVSTCASVWSCPVCSAKIRQRRATEIDTLAARWEAGGDLTQMVTLTVPHHAFDSLAELWDAVADGWRKLVSGRRWMTAKRALGIAGWTRAVEVTFGENGWHVHIHALLFIRADRPAVNERTADRVRMVEQQRRRSEAWFRMMWLRWIERRLGRAGSPDHAARVTAGAGGYVSKVSDDGIARGKWRIGLELARGDLKEARRAGMTPFGLLAAALDTGESEMVARWGEWERGSHGRRMLTWAVGTRDLLGAEPEKSDEALAAAEADGDLVAVVPGAVWWAWDRDGRAAEILSLIEREDWEALPPDLRSLLSVPDRRHSAGV